MPIHPAKQNRLIFVFPVAELRVKHVLVRPELQRQSLHLKDVAAHPAPSLLGFRHKRWQLVECFHLIARIRSNEAETTLNRMTMRIDKSRKETLPLEIHSLGVFGYGLFNFRQIPNCDDLLSANGNCVRVRIQRVCSKYFRVEE